MELSKGAIEELFNIAINQPVFAGDLISHQTEKELRDKGLAMRYEGESVLTTKGREEYKILKSLFTRLLTYTNQPKK